MKFTAALKVFLHSTCPRLYEPLERWYSVHHEKSLGGHFRENAEPVFALFVEAMREAEATFWPTYGTLLGCIRDHGIIPHDNDFDMAILATSDTDRIHQAMTARGFTLKRTIRLYSMNGTNEQGFELSYEKDGVGIDLFAATVHADHIVYHEFLNSRVGDGFRLWDTARAITIPFEGLMDYEFLGQQIKVPTNYDAYLTTLYGPWRVPDPNWRREMSPAASVLPGCVGIRFDR